MTNSVLNCLLLCLVTSQLLVLEITSQSEDTVENEEKSQHHLVKRSVVSARTGGIGGGGIRIGGGGRGLGLGRSGGLGGSRSGGYGRSGGSRGYRFGKKQSQSGGWKKAKSRYPKQTSYPKQPSSSGNYRRAPPPYPGTNSRPRTYPVAPPPYPGTANQLPPSYNTGSLPGRGTFLGTGLGRGSSLGKVGSAGFGAAAGTAMGAYGGYKLGRMVGSLGTAGHFGYYNDEGRYIRCGAPKFVKVDPETNIDYIPPELKYNSLCRYFDKQPPERWESE